VARPSLVDAAALATEAGVAAQVAHPHHQITIYAAGPLLVCVDPLAITRILGNLLDNAATHAPPGSLIRLIGGRDGHEAVLAVQDQGPGIAADARERIFERYARVDRHAGLAAGGLGLGL
jgi:two-component system OmpR family sensor kinase